MADTIDMTPTLVRFCSRTYPPPTDRVSYFGKQILIPKVMWDFINKHHRGQIIELCESGGIEPVIT